MSGPHRLVQFGSTTHETAEDRPKLRSVPYQGTQQHLGFAGLPPLQSGIPTSILTSAKSGTSLHGGNASFFGVKNEWDGSVTSYPETATTTWEVQLEDLEQVPEFFPLEKTHREISEDPSVIASRISDTLQVLSIQTEFCNKTIKAKCQTNDYVKFRIRLYAGSEIGVPVVVEIQRRSGSPRSFMRTCRVLLDAASAGKIPTPESEAVVRKAHAMECPITPPLKRLKCLEKVLAADQDTSQVVTKELDAVVALSNGESKHEQEVLALENLLCLTDPLKSSPCTAIQASEAVFSNCHLRDIILEQATGSDDHDGMGKLVERKRQLAFAVFANALESKASSLTGCEEGSWFSVKLIPVILEAIQEAPKAACVAFQASRCASQVMSQSAELRLIMERYRSVLDHAYEYGQSRHELLRDEMKLCLTLLNN